LTTAGVVVRGSTAEAFGEHMAREFKRWNAVREGRGFRSSELVGCPQMQPFPRHCPAETSHDATKAAIRRISLGSVSSGA
jgi:hypothetical protein